MEKDKIQPLSPDELDLASGGWTDDELQELVQAQRQILHAACPNCGLVGWGSQMFASYHEGRPGMVCRCSCKRYGQYFDFIVLSDGSAYEYKD